MMGLNVESNTSGTLYALETDFHHRNEENMQKNGTACPLWVELAVFWDKEPVAWALCECYRHIEQEQR